MKQKYFLILLVVTAILWFFNMQEAPKVIQPVRTKASATKPAAQKTTSITHTSEMAELSLPANEKLKDVSIEEVNAALKDSGYVAVPAGDGQVEISAPGPAVLEVSEIKSFSDDEWALEQEAHLQEVNGFDVELSQADREMIERWRRR